MSAPAALAEEALRQEVSSLRDALAERQRELTNAHDARQHIEDKLEDAAHEIERLRRHSGTAAPVAAEPDAAESAAAVTAEPDGGPDTEDLLEQGLRDHRLKPPRRALDAKQVTGGSRVAPLLLGVAAGLLLVVGALELATHLSGRGVLFQFLFGVGG